VSSPVPVLVVDDEPDMCWALGHVLRQAGYAVTSTTRGMEALELLETEPFVLAFVDAMLPDLDGHELAATIRAEKPQMAIILISGYYYPEDPAVVESLDKLCDAFVAKPFGLDTIRQVIRRVLLERERL
jgi:DNA-binding response OmpR family regulator